MSFFKKLKLRTKLFAVFYSVVLLFIITALVGYNGIYTIVEDVKVFKSHAIEQELVGGMQTNLAFCMSAFHARVLHGDQKQEKVFSERLQKLKQYANEFILQTDDVEKKNKILEMIVKADEFQGGFVKILAFESTIKNEDKDSLTNEMDLLHLEISSMIEDVKLSLANDQKRFATTVDRDSSVAIEGIVIIAIVALGLVIILSILIARMITKPIGVITQTQEELQKTNIELEERADLLESQKKDILIKNEFLKSAQIEIQDKAKALEIAGMYKSEFLANMSHELRTPLNSILVLSQLILNRQNQSPLTEKELEFAQTINTSGKDLLRLINDILDLSKVEAGKMELVIDQVNVHGIADNLRRLFGQVAEEKGLSFEAIVEEKMPEYIQTDGLRLHQVLKNLISNALKFTNAGQIKVTICRPKNDHSLLPNIPLEKTICILVEDTGIGIEEDKQEIVFEAFRQIDGTCSRKFGGTGLGLSISKELARLLNGKIELESKVGKGSIFSFILPETIEKNDEDAMISLDLLEEMRRKDKEEFLRKSQFSKQNINKFNSIIAKVPKSPHFSNGLRHIKMGKTIKGSMHKSQDNLKDKKLLLVDNDIRNIFVLTNTLESYGFKVIASRNGKEALIKLQVHNEIDIILMNVMMPEMDGYWAMRRIREKNEWKNTPMIALSSKALEEDKNQCIEAGANAYITKPIDSDQLISLINTCIFHNSKKDTKEV